MLLETIQNCCSNSVAASVFQTDGAPNIQNVSNPIKHGPMLPNVLIIMRFGCNFVKIDGALAPCAPYLRPHCNWMSGQRFVSRLKIDIRKFLFELLRPIKRSPDYSYQGGIADRLQWYFRFLSTKLQVNFVHLIMLHNHDTSHHWLQQ